MLKDTLQARGSLDQIRARVRAEIFAALDDQVERWRSVRPISEWIANVLPVVVPVRAKTDVVERESRYQRAHSRVHGVQWLPPHTVGIPARCEKFQLRHPQFPIINCRVDPS